MTPGDKPKDIISLNSHLYVTLRGHVTSFKGHSLSGHESNMSIQICAGPWNVSRKCEIVCFGMCVSVYTCS